MRPKLHVISLVVDDLESATHFYRDGLGLPTQGIVAGYEDHVIFELEGGLTLVLYVREEFGKITGEAAKPTGYYTSSVVLSYFTATKEEVTTLLDKAVKAGAVLLRPAREETWGGYGGYFKDPDGHVWEIMWNPHYPKQ